jgi:ChrR Cupin-like domain
MMNHPKSKSPVRADRSLDDECLHLLAVGLADGAPEPGGSAQPSEALRSRLVGRVARSAQAARAFVTVRHKDAVAQPLGDAVAERTLYRCADGAALRAGEPWRVRVLDLAPGADRMVEVLPGSACEWLVMDGALSLDGQALEARDFQRVPSSSARHQLASVTGARVYLRESKPAAVQAGLAGDQAVSVIDALASWDDFAPGIRRRVLWHCNGEAAMLYQAQAGAAVPRHGHGRDEECLMLDGDVFLDDVLLCKGDYQIAPAGTEHEGVSTDQGGVLFAHGDLDLALIA